MKQITGNKLLVRALKEEGVDTLFGYPGACTIDISDELYKQDEIRVILPVMIVGTLIFWSQFRNLNMMLLGDETSITLGTDLHRVRMFYMALSSIMVGFAVYAAGMIGFVGLIIPHVIRMFFGTDHKKMIPLCALAGAIFLIWADVACRSILKNSEIPVGILVSMIGAPCFIYLMIRRSYVFGGAK